MSTTSRKQLGVALIALLVITLPISAAWAQGGQDTIVLNVSGMTEQRCEDTVGNLLDNVTGVRTFSSDHEADKITVQFDPSTVTAEQVAAAIERCPSFDVTGSETHVLDMAEVRELAESCPCCDDEGPSA